MATFPLTVTNTTRDGIEVLTSATPFLEANATVRFDITLSPVQNLTAADVNPMLIDDTQVSLEIFNSVGDFIRSDQILSYVRNQLPPQYKQASFDTIPPELVTWLSTYRARIERNPDRVVLIGVPVVRAHGNGCFQVFFQSTRCLPLSRYIPVWDETTPPVEGA
jgi:hypothetical protein